jgi:hypothetical protein
MVIASPYLCRDPASSENAARPAGVELVWVDAQDLSEAGERRAKPLIGDPEVTVWADRHARGKGEPRDDRRTGLRLVNAP